jgi:hypothetical protein
VRAQTGRLDSTALVAAIERARTDGRAGAGVGSAGRRSAEPGDGSAWQIQLGAVPSRAGAARLLDEALADVPALRKRERLTLPVTTASGTLYRARLTGFASREAAHTACKRFTNHDRPCWAVSK